MDPATAGVVGAILTAVVAATVQLLRALKGTHIRSRCCGREASIDVTSDGSPGGPNQPAAQREPAPDKRFLRLPHHDVLPRPPFTMTILGRIGAGKTSLLWSMLDRLYARYWDEVVILSGTMDSREAWLGLAPKKQKRVAVLHEYDEEALTAYLEQLQHDQMERMTAGKQPLRTCIVLDDLVGGGSSSRSRATALERLMLTCRHEYNATVKSISPNQRANTLYWALYPVATVDQGKVVQEHANHAPVDVFHRMLAHVWAQPHQFLLVSYRTR